jgi:hypothetical protein
VAHSAEYFVSPLAKKELRRSWEVWMVKALGTVFYK